MSDSPAPRLQSPTWSDVPLRTLAAQPRAAHRFTSLASASCANGMENPTSEAARSGQALSHRFALSPLTTTQPTRAKQCVANARGGSRHYSNPAVTAEPLTVVRKVNNETIGLPQRAREHRTSDGAPSSTTYYVVQAVRTLRAHHHERAAKRGPPLREAMTPEPSASGFGVSWVTTTAHWLVRRISPLATRPTRSTSTPWSLG